MNKPTYRVNEISNGEISVHYVEHERDGEWFDAFEDPSKELCEAVVGFLNKDKSKPDGLPWTTDRVHVKTLGELKQIVDAAIAEHGADTPVGYSSAGNQDYQDGLRLEHFRVSELSIQFLHGDRVVQSPVNPVTDVPVFIIG